MSRTCRQKSPFTSRTSPPTLRAGSSRAIREELLDVRIHARRRLAGADGPDDGHARVEPALWNDEPRRLARASRHRPMMLLAEDQKEITTGVGTRVERPRGRSAVPSRDEDVEAREDDAGPKNGVLNHSVA